LSRCYLHYATTPEQNSPSATYLSPPRQTFPPWTFLGLRQTDRAFREDLGLGTGAPFAVLRLGDGLVLLPEQHRFDHFCQQVSSILTAAGLTSEAVLATLPEARKRVYARRYAKAPSLRPTRILG
jgi:hypothetical protein